MSGNANPDWKTSKNYAEYDKVRESMILAAAELIEADGLEKLRLDQVAKKVGCVRQTVYRYFNSKKDIAEAVLLDFTLINAEAVIQHVSGIEDAEERLLEIIYFGAKNFAHNPKFRIFLDARNSKLFESLSFEALPDLLDQYEFDIDFGVMDLTTKDVSSKDMYTWVLMQIVSLASFGLINRGEDEVKQFIRNLIIRGPL